MQVGDVVRVRTTSRRARIIEDLGSARYRVLFYPDPDVDALDRDTRPRPDIDRQEVYRRIRARMDDELAKRPANAAAAYWRAAAARGQGDLQSAWDAAVAAWVSAALAADGGAQLRADVDRLVTRAIVPDRAKLLGQPPQRLLADWEQFKTQWAK